MNKTTFHTHQQFESLVQALLNNTPVNGIERAMLATLEGVRTFTAGEKKFLTKLYNKYPQTQLTLNYQSS